ncbi:MAG: DUF3332 domain-containing protein [Fibromonadales bacterium]|nr:DUF3332 domain-containing protein [Fibromonadales bacterium]
MKKVLMSLLVACVLTVSTVSTTGCYGSFAAFNKLRVWNGKFTGNKFVNWLVFLVLNIIPVYGLFFTADALLINSIEFWTGSNPVALGDTYRETDAEGNSVTAVKMEDGSLYMRLDTKTGESQELVLQRDEEIVRILDAKGNLLKEAAFAE